MSDVTHILDAMVRGEPQAAAQLLPMVYDELRRLAARRLAGEPPGQTLDATALVHEAFLRPVGDDPGRPWHGRGHFFAAAAEAMRRILVESARRKRRLKHGGGLSPAAVEPDLLPARDDRSLDVLLSVDPALDRLAEADPAAAELVELRYSEVRRWCARCVSILVLWGAIVGAVLPIASRRSIPRRGITRRAVHPSCASLLLSRTNSRALGIILSGWT